MIAPSETPGTADTGWSRQAVDEMAAQLAATASQYFDAARHYLELGRVKEMAFCLRVGIEHAMRSRFVAAFGLSAMVPDPAVWAQKLRGRLAISSELCKQFGKAWRGLPNTKPGELWQLASVLRTGVPQSTNTPSKSRTRREAMAVYNGVTQPTGVARRLHREARWAMEGANGKGGAQ